MTKILLSSKQRKEIDRVTIEEYLIPGEELVENAGRALEKEVLEAFPSGRKKIEVYCGPGNNGADGLAAARMLSQRGHDVKVRLVGNEARHTALFAHEKWLLPQEVIIEDYAGAPDADIVIDAMLGIGLNRDLEGSFLFASEQINRYKKENGCFVLSADIPTGLDADTGRVHVNAVNADHTVVMGYACPGHFLTEGRDTCGKIKIADIGLVSPEKAGIIPFASADHMGELPVHKSFSHKGDYGKLFVYAGSEGMAGAAMFASEAAYRAGCGLVYLETARENYGLLQMKVPEAVLTRYDRACRGISAVVAGCGIGRTADAAERLIDILSSFKGNVLLDADALFLTANCKRLSQAVKEHGSVIVTPHAGELAALTGLSVSEVNADLTGAAGRCALEYGCICVAKSNATVICSPDKEEVFINIKGNSGMAVAGSGDVLAGTIGGLLARGMQRFDAAVLGVSLHAMAGDAAAAELGMSHMLARDIIDHMKDVTAAWEDKRMLT